MWHHRRKVLWACIFAGWMLIALSFTLNYYFFSRHYVAIFSDPPSLAGMLVWEIPYWLLWALLAPAVFQLTKWFPLGKTDRVRNIAFHFVACAVLTIGHRGIYLGLCWLLRVDAYRGLPSLNELIHSDLFFNLPTGFMSYGTILLVSNVVEYYERYEAGRLRAARLETDLARAELQALKMQLHPHFLFNTLNSISALQMTDVESANRMTARLGDFLRLTLDNVGAQEVSLDREMEFLRCYLDIELVRFQDRLNVEIEISPDAAQAAVPNLFLQPLVENAIRHGIGASVSSGSIVIRAQRTGGRLVLTVRDDGPGLVPAGNGSVREGIGISNTKSRLRRHFGEAQSVELKNGPDGGMEVTLDLPFVPFEENGGEGATTNGRH